MTVAQWLTLALTSGLVAGVTNQIAAAIRERWERRHDSEERTKDRDFELLKMADERQHQAAIRAEADHAAARAQFVELANNVHLWIDYTWTKAYGPDVDFYGARPKPHLQSEQDVLDALDTIAGLHPTASVRAAAGYLAGKIDAQYGEAHPEHNEPTADTFEDWDHQARRLLELIHVSKEGTLIKEIDSGGTQP